MIRLVSFFFTVGATAIGGALVAIQTLMLVRGDGGNYMVLGAAILALVVGLYGLAADIRRSKSAIQALREGRPVDLWAPPRGTPKLGVKATSSFTPIASDAPSLTPYVAPAVPAAAADGTAPITDILAAERARSDAYWRSGIAQLQAQAVQAGAGDGAVVLLEVAARSLAQALGPRHVARILREASDRYAAEGDRPARDAGAA
ncbi:MAG: hypothetical protein HXX10_19710 [Rhodoplanes sp.]|uniref:hypothetical protein n=1 Tax=Rhodoplanes sp. TaxID=1968906 RepID=UPI0018067950|nr:hypothetical protein [Rhodoplanes sp.]NVO16264.1 hypothetical protein [Rhodoplanes sp.]